MASAFFLPSGVSDPMFDLSFGLGNLPVPPRVSSNTSAAAPNLQRLSYDGLGSNWNTQGLLGDTGVSHTNSAGSRILSAAGGANRGRGFGDLNFGEKANTVLSGLQTIGGLWNAFQAQKLARQQFKHTRDVTDTNLANQIQSYNTALTDRITSRAKVQGMSQGEVDSYMNDNRLKDRRG